MSPVSGIYGNALTYPAEAGHAVAIEGFSNRDRASILE
jgi:hypothetical protein